MALLFFGSICMQIVWNITDQWLVLSHIGCVHFKNIRRLLEHFKRFCIFEGKYSLLEPPPTISSLLEFPPCLIYFSPKSLRESDIQKVRVKPVDFVFLLKFLFFNMKYTCNSKHLYTNRRSLCQTFENLNVAPWRRSLGNLWYRIGWRLLHNM